LCLFYKSYVPFLQTLINYFRLKNQPEALNYQDRLDSILENRPDGTKSLTYTNQQSHSGCGW